MTHTYEHNFDSPDQGCNVLCVIEYEAENAEYLGKYVIDGELHVLSVKFLYIEGYDPDGNEVYNLTRDEMAEDWAEALDLIADAHVRESLDDGCSCLGECLWQNAGFCI
jgi:hypothetical protein